MKILLNGATGGTNFGDYLFAQIFHDSVSELVGEDNIFWYDSRYCMSDYFKKYLNCHTRKHKIDDIDALVCISGGYFCGNDKSLRHYIIRYLRYFHLCIRCIFKKIPIAIIGVDVSKSKSKLIDKIQQYILRNSEIIVVRNRDSLDQLKRYGVNNAICTADTAHVIVPEMFENCKVQENILCLKGKKLFFHVQPSSIYAARQLIPVIDRFVASHTEYSVVISADQFWGDDSFLEELVGNFSCDNVVINHFENPMELCKVLSMMDFIITPKLHIGIVGATLSKSVVSFSVHTEKISRFYSQINEKNRSMPMEVFSEEKALELLEKYHNVPICIGKEIIEAAESNLKYLERFINDIR